VLLKHKNKISYTCIHMLKDWLLQRCVQAYIQLHVGK